MNTCFGPPCELEQQAELRRGQRHSSPRLRTLNEPGSISRSPIAIVSPAGSARGPAQHGLDPRHELGQLERLRDVVVGAELEPDDHVVLLAARGQHEIGTVALAPDLPADLEAVERRQHHVEHDEVERAPAGSGRARRARPRRGDAEPGLLEPEGRDLADRGVVLDEQDVLVHGRSLRPAHAGGEGAPAGRRLLCA